MAKLVFIGDVHGKFDQLLSILNEYKDADRVYQVGDFGVGFPDTMITPVFPPNFRFIRGNHDNPFEARLHDNFLGEYGVDEFGVGYLGGAWSIDHEFRTPGVDFWYNEELGVRDLEEAVDYLTEQMPLLMITHCAPDVFGGQLVWGMLYPTKTTDALNALYEKHKPDTWICGHYHKPVDARIGAVRFKCLNELEVLELEV